MESIAGLLRPEVAVHLDPTARLRLSRSHAAEAPAQHPNHAKSRGRPREALGHLVEAVRIEPQNEVAHFRLASVYKTLGDTPNYQKEMAFFQKLHSAGNSDVPLTSPSVTQQVIDPESRMPP